MKNRVKIIVAHFGGILPESFPLFLKSCENNKEFEWIMFTDVSTEKYNIPQNYKIERMSLSDIKTIAEKKLAMEVSLEKPYKMCDFKVAYGFLFSEYLTGCDFWGVCDYDVIFGDLSRYITDTLLDNYDKIYTLGHLFFFRNTKKCNEAFMIKSKYTQDYQLIYKTKCSFFFDESNLGINKKAELAGLRIYKNIQCIDRSLTHERYCSVSKCEMRDVFNTIPFFKKIPKNYRYQLFVWEQGRIFRYYLRWGMQREEYAYIHFRGKLTVLNAPNESKIAICQKGFVPCDTIDKKQIMKLNPPRGVVSEFVESLRRKRYFFSSIVVENGKINWKTFVRRIPIVRKTIMVIKLLLTDMEKNNIMNRE